MEKIRGIIERGAGRGAYFTGLDWVRGQCRRKLGWEPHPGTLNVRVIEEDLERLDGFLGNPELALVPEDPAFCAARVRRVTVNGVPAAVVLPAEEVRIHEHRVLELLAATGLKDALGLGEGDAVTVSAGSGVDAESDPQDAVRDLYEFASSAGALEGYVFPGETRDLSYLDDWVSNLARQYDALPAGIRGRVQDGVNRTVGRAVLSLGPVLGKDHPHLRALRSMVKGPLPDSSRDFELEKREKAERYGEAPVKS